MYKKEDSKYPPSFIVNHVLAHSQGAEVRREGGEEPRFITTVDFLGQYFMADFYMMPPRV